MWKSAIALGAGLWFSVGCKGSDPKPGPGSAAGSSTELGKVDQALSQIVASSAEVNGTVEVRRQGQVRWERVAVGTTFRERDWVRTGKTSFVRLRFANRGYIDLGADTTLLVDKALSLDAGTLVAVAEGSESFTVKSADGSEARIAPATPDTQFRLTHSPTGLEIAVTKGSAKVTGTDGEHALNAGEAADLANQKLGAVAKLLAFPRSIAPGIDARYLFKPDMHIPIAWKPVDGAIRYQVQIARDTEFHIQITSIETSTLSTSFTPDAKGIYAWRVVARDANGRLGELGFARRIYCEGADPRDQLVGPPDGTKLVFPTKPPEVEFSWQPLGDVEKYKLVLRREGSDNDIVTTTTTAAQRASLTLEPGAYRWGVYAIKPDREDPIFLSMRLLTVTKQQGPKIHTEVQWDTPKH